MVMAGSIADILAQRDFDEPPEIRYIIDFTMRHVGITPSVTTTNYSYIIKTQSASAAGVLRTKINLLQKELNTDKRIIVRIS
jgi:hypothetical protein